MTRRVRCTRAFQMGGGRIVQPGEVLEVDRDLAGELQRAGRAEIVNLQIPKATLEPKE